MIAQPLILNPTYSAEDIDAAFQLEDSYDVLIVLQRLTNRKCVDLGLSFADLSYSERLVSYILWFHTDVAIGLLEPFFVSERGTHAQAMLEALQLIGAINNANIFECALSVFPFSRPSREHAQRRQQLHDAGQGRRMLFNALDRAYAYEAEDAPTLAVEYLTQHQDDFV